MKELLQFSLPEHSKGCGLGVFIEQVRYLWQYWWDFVPERETAMDMERLVNLSDINLYSILLSILTQWSVLRRGVIYRCLGVSVTARPRAF